MTNEEAIEYNKNLRMYMQITDKNSSHKFLEENYIALDMAIKALEGQEPCEDAISRQAVLELLQMKYFGKNLYKAVYELPPVTPQTKIGHWIMPVQDDGMSDPIFYQVRCSECGFDLDPQTWHMELHQYGADKYCPNCGAKIEVEE